MKNIIIGTAGHVDHGKTMLVKALTGIDTDRLREEKERGISIELGFASLDLPGGLRAGIVDVPGHERFIKNMLAGVGGIDLVMLVIAADEGIMPQTREHMDIIQLLQVDQGVVVITKSDLVDDEWMELVELELNEFLGTTTLSGAPIVKVSAVTGYGLPELKETLARLAREVKPRPAAGRARLPVDRVFTVTGFGTVVTGTLQSGRLQPGDTVEIMPDRILTRIRSLQVHGHKSDFAQAGQRTAINLTGVEVEQVDRGSVVAVPGLLNPSFRLDLKLTLLDGAAKPIRHRARVRFYLGTAELLGRVMLLDREELEPGATTYVQLQLEKPAVATKGDRFVIRTYSPMRTIGGGSVIDPSPRKHRLRQAGVIADLATREMGTASEIVYQQLAISGPKPLTETDLLKSTGFSGEDVTASLRELSEQGEIKNIPVSTGYIYVAQTVCDDWGQTLSNLLKTYHQEYPLREGYPREELRSRYFPHFNAKLFPYLLQQLEDDGLITVHAQTITIKDYSLSPGPELAAILAGLEQAYLDSLFLTPLWSEVCRTYGINDETAGQEILQYMIRKGKLVKIGDGMYLHSKAVAKGKLIVLDFLQEHGEISIGQARDILQTSRKFTLPLLEFFDREKVTRRVGDLRVPGRSVRPS